MELRKCFLIKRNGRRYILDIPLNRYFENGDSGGGSGGSVSPPPAKRLGIFSPPYPSVGISPDLPAHARDYRTPAPPPDDEWKNIHVVRT